MGEENFIHPIYKVPVYRNIWSAWIGYDDWLNIINSNEDEIEVKYRTFNGVKSKIIKVSSIRVDTSLKLNANLNFDQFYQVDKKQLSQRHLGLRFKLFDESTNSPNEWSSPPSKEKLFGPHPRAIGLLDKMYPKFEENLRLQVINEFVEKLSDRKRADRIRKRLKIAENIGAKSTLEEHFFSSFQFK